MSDPRITIEANRRRFGTFSWQGQSPQYDQLGPAGGIVYRRFKEGPAYVDTLLHYDEAGNLDGILNTYPTGGVGPTGVVLERPGDVNIFTRPDVESHRVATARVAGALMAEAERRWKVKGETPTRWVDGDTTVDPGSVGGSLGGIDGNRRISSYEPPE